MSDIRFRLAEVERRVANLIRMGVIQEVDTAAARVRVTVGPLVTAWIPWLTQRAGEAAVTWQPPSVGEQVLVVSPGGDMALGVAIPAIYRTDYAPPSNDPQVIRTVYEDGASVEYDLAAHKLKAVLPAGSAEVEAPEIKATATTKITFTSPQVEVDGALKVTGDITAGPTNLSFLTHKHTGVQSGGALTGTPNLA